MVYVNNIHITTTSYVSWRWKDWAGKHGFTETKETIGYGQKRIPTWSDEKFRNWSRGRRQGIFKTIFLNRHLSGFDKTCTPESMLESQRKASGVRKKNWGRLPSSTTGAVSLGLGITTLGSLVSTVEFQACLGVVVGEPKFSLLLCFSSKDFDLINGQYCFLPCLLAKLCSLEHPNDFTFDRVWGYS